MAVSIQESHIARSFARILNLANQLGILSDSAVNTLGDSGKPPATVDGVIQLATNAQLREQDEYFRRRLKEHLRYAKAMGWARDADVNTVATNDSGFIALRNFFLSDMYSFLNSDNGQLNRDLADGAIDMIGNL